VVLSVLTAFAAAICLSAAVDIARALLGAS
jgi:hypothetical protein